MESSSGTSTGASAEGNKNGSKSIIVVGAGLAGALLSVYLARRGYKVDVYERREDIRTAEVVEGRSINLALSTRGLTALEKAGMGNLGSQLGTPMYGRIIHAQEEHPDLEFQQYGVDPRQHLMSISRTVLNERLITAAEAHPLVRFHFRHRCLKTDFAANSIQFLDETTGETVTATADIILGSDGAYSSVRAGLQKTQYFNFSQYFLDHAYKELTLSPAADGSYQLPSNGLHIWPRENFMLIGLPNLDKSFTITLFMPVAMFESLQTKEDVRRFFTTYFPDALRLMPNVPEQVQAMPRMMAMTAMKRA
jgi:kynurenine 3-monooxygenase